MPFTNRAATATNRWRSSLFRRLTRPGFPQLSTGFHKHSRSICWSLVA